MPTFPRGHAHRRTHTQNRRRLKNCLDLAALA